MKKGNLPKFLFAEDLKGSRYFVIHCHKPRCVIEFTEDEEGFENGQVIEEIDKFTPENFGCSDDDYTIAVARLMRQSGEFLSKYDTILLSKNYTKNHTNQP